MTAILEHHENRDILAFLDGRLGAKSALLNSARPLSYLPPEDPGFGIHPDAVQYFWTILPSLIPLDCKLEIYGFPVLVNPTSGVIFGVAFGFNYLCLRLPGEIATTCNGGEKKQLSFPEWQQREFSGIPDDWLVLKWGLRDPERCLAAYRLAGGLSIMLNSIRRGWWFWTRITLCVEITGHDCSMPFVVEEVTRSVRDFAESQANVLESVAVKFRSWIGVESIESVQDRLKESFSSQIFVPITFH